jgi:hypothetical protein
LVSKVASEGLALRGEGFLAREGAVVHGPNARAGADIEDSFGGLFKRSKVQLVIEKDHEIVVATKSRQTSH